jgi:hypothetical protein
MLKVFNRLNKLIYERGFIMTKKEVLENLENVYKTLLECDVAIKELNSNGEQFNFCNSSKLSDLADNIVNRANRIQDTVYEDGFSNEFIVH